MKTINLIVAVSLDGIIGDRKSNNIPWHIPEDLKYFKELTKNNTVIMGSNTFDSIGKCLPNRKNVVITRNADKANKYTQVGVAACYKSLEEALIYEQGSIWIIGGEHVYTESLKQNIDCMYITIVDKSDVVGDVKFVNGSLFLENNIQINNINYSCVDRSEWFSVSNLKYQFTKFKN